MGLAAVAVLLTVGIHPVRAGRPSCMLFLRSGSQLCYPPSDVLHAQRRAGFALVDPQAAVVSTTHLHLTQVSLISTDAGHLVQFAYIYGKLPNGVNLLGLPGPNKAPYLLIQEVRGVIAPSHPRVARSGAFGPWSFDVGVPRRTISLSLDSNLSRYTVARIGQQLLAAARAGK